MIITQKQFPNYKKYEIMYEGRPLSMEGRQDGGAVQRRRARQIR